jgi:hypothetical protein
MSGKEVGVRGRACSVCSHPALDNIDAALIRRRPYREIAGRFGVSDSALSRHLNEHLAADVQKALSERATSKGVKVMDRLAGMIDRLDGFLDRAEEDKDGPEFRATAAELRKQLELIAKLQGELAQEGTTNISVKAEWLEVRALIVSALEPHPEAKRAVVAALEGAGNG